MAKKSAHLEHEFSHGKWGAVAQGVIAGTLSGIVAATVYELARTSVVARTFSFPTVGQVAKSSLFTSLVTAGLFGWEAHRDTNQR